MRVLLTGARGFLGSHLLPDLQRRGAWVVELVRDEVLRPPDGQPIYPGDLASATVHGDIENLPLLERIVAEYGVDTVIHLAAQAGVATASQDPTGTFRTNIMGTINVLEACRRQKVGRVIVASTDKVMGQHGKPYTEDMPLLERSPYGASKVCADVLAQTYANTYGMNIAITRCGNLYGPKHYNFSTLIPGTIRKVLHGERPRVRFGGEATRDFLYVSDASRAYCNLAERSVTGVFNFSGGKAIRILDVVASIIKHLGSNLEPEITNESIGEIKNQELDCTKAKTVLGWKPQYSFEEGLKKTIEWYQWYFAKETVRELV